MNKYIAILVVVLLVGGAAFAIWKFYPWTTPVSTSQAPVDGPGLVIEDIVVGQGPELLPADVKDTPLVVQFVAKLPNGVTFDSSNGGPYYYMIGSGGKPKGWDIGLIGMRSGGKRVLIVPPELAYGSVGAGLVPPNSTVIYEIELMTTAHVDPPGELKGIKPAL
ncbi:FKBP-type peptidyl-prolyl cis-trans isomerase [Candidatus Parcubacteria bacterium]|nr:FKBP-type peptidyl-prolyl cis-trans isomerase [Candidatus Parcubacteria bacterium]